MASSRNNPCLEMNDNAMTVGIRSMRSQNLFLDLTIEVEGKTFNVHKLVMASTSEYFRAMLSVSMAESQKDTVKIEGVSSDTMAILIDFIYNNNLELTKENAVEILAAAMYLQIETAIHISTKYIINNLDVDNWDDALKLFNNYNLMEGVDNVKNYLKKDIRNVAKGINQGQLSIEELQFFIDHWQSSEYELFKLIRDWLSADASQREKHCNELLKEVRYCLMTQTELQFVKESHCNSEHAWCDLVERALEYHKLPMHKKVLVKSEQQKMRSVPSFVMFSGDQSADKGYFYEPLKERRFVESDKLKMPVNSALVWEEIEVNNFLIVCGTANPGSCQHWHIFDPRTLEWSTMADLQRQIQGTVFAHDDKLYTLGGEDFVYLPIFHIEQYNFETDTWTNFSQLPLPVKLFGACIFEDHLYVLGGELEEDFAFAHGLVVRGHEIPAFSNLVVRLNLSTLQWQSRAPMFKRRYNFLANVMEILSMNVICVFDEAFNLEYYTPVNDQWSKCAFSFNIPLPLRDPPLERELKMEWVRGNSIYVADATTKFSEDKKACAVVTFPRDGMEASVDILHEYKGKLEGSHLTVLSVAYNKAYSG